MSVTSGFPFVWEMSVASVVFGIDDGYKGRTDTGPPLYVILHMSDVRYFLASSLSFSAFSSSSQSNISKCRMPPSEKRV